MNKEVFFDLSDMSLKHPSNLAQRVIVAVPGIPLLLWLTWSGGVAFLGLVVLLAVLATGEFHHLARRKAEVLPPGYLMAFTALFQANLFFGFTTSLVLFLLLFMVLVVREVFQEAGSRILNIGASLAVVAYVNISFGSLLLIRLNDLVGVHLVFLMLVCVWAADISAYFAGRALGGRFFRKKFFERLSPRKTWEGYLAGVVSSVLAAFVFAFADPGLDMVMAAVTGIGIGALGPLGDLVESMFKRDAGVKDSSALIPGHGGVLDRFDSLMFVSPLVYLLMLFFYITPS